MSISIEKYVTLRDRVSELEDTVEELWRRLKVLESRHRRRRTPTQPAKEVEKTCTTCGGVGVDTMSLPAEFCSSCNGTGTTKKEAGNG